MAAKRKILFACVLASGTKTPVPILIALVCNASNVFCLVTFLISSLRVTRLCIVDLAYSSVSCMIQDILSLEIIKRLHMNNCRFYLPFIRLTGLPMKLVIGPYFVNCRHSI